MLTREQLAWAKQHDWFVRELNDGRVMVRDQWLALDDRTVCEEEIVWTNSFAALRLWAGYREG